MTGHPYPISVTKFILLSHTHPKPKTKTGSRIPYPLCDHLLNPVPPPPPPPPPPLVPNMIITEDFVKKQIISLFCFFQPTLQQEFFIQPKLKREIFMEKTILSLFIFYKPNCNEKKISIPSKLLHNVVKKIIKKTKFSSQVVPKNHIANDIQSLKEM